APVVAGQAAPDVAHLGELAPLWRLEAARLLLHDATALLEGRRLGEEVAGRAAEQLLVVGQLETHGSGLRQAEHALGDDVALHLGRSGVDRAGAGPEKLARPRRRGDW